MTTPVLVLALVLAPMVAVAAINLLSAPRLHRSPVARTGPRVSVLVPARDEAGNLSQLLPRLLASDYEPLEVLVLDDGSSDGTGQVVRDHARSDPRVTLIQGAEPPAGWTGKNWACHQLAHHAGGEILLFCDADVRPGPAAVARTVASMERAGADALTAIPRHERGGWFEQAVIPLVATVPILALLPLRLVRWRRFRSLSVGNGQWFAWRRAAYRRVGGHRRVRGDILEDVRLGRLAKAAGLRLTAVLAGRDLAVRMYPDGPATWDGFGKNLYLLAGGRPWTLALAIAVVLASGLGPVLLALTPGLGPTALLPLAELAAIRLMAARMVGDPARSVALHPLGVLAVTALAVASWRRHRQGTVAWKQRILTHKESV